MRRRDRAEIEFDATLRERTRLPADLHDTLEQALTGLAFQLDTSSMLAPRSPAEGSLEPTIRDAGAGFDPAHAQGLPEGHFGLQGMKERANRLDGALLVESQPGQGATVRVRVPLPDPSPAEDLSRHQPRNRGTSGFHKKAGTHSSDACRREG